MSVRSFSLGALLALASALPAAAQWINYPTAGIPRTKDGKANLAAKTPRLQNGKPDLSGLWESDSPLKYLGNLAADLKGEVPMTPWARDVAAQRTARRGADDPDNFCMPTNIVRKHAVPAPFKIIQNPNLLVILYESRTIYRQIFTDARPFPEDPNPAWLGYSVGHWEGDTLVVESMGFNGKAWLDGQGRPMTEDARVVEKFTRPMFGKLEVDITITDPKAYTAPWGAHETMHYLPDSELIEHICEENNKFPDQIAPH